MGALVGQGGRAIGIDTSAALAALAREHAPDQDGRVQFVVGDGAALPLGSDVADAVKIDRTLQHVAQPQAVVDDMYRVLRVGGRAACAEPDWATLTITSDDVDTTRLVAQTWGDSFRQGWIGRGLVPMMRSAGFVDVELTGHLLITEGFKAMDEVFDLSRTVQRMGGGHEAERSTLTTWLEDLRRLPTPQLAATVTLFLASGTKR